MKKPKISVAVATFNEEKNIGPCLESVRQLADEIIVVDGGSTDKTVEIAKKYGAKVIVTDNPPIFHINKQKAIDAATGDWILQLDADEMVTPELKKEVQDVIRDTKYDGYWIPRKNYFLGRYLTKGGQYPDYTLRLYRHGKGHLPCKSVHEQAMVQGKVGYLINALLHNADPTFKRYLQRNSRYIDLMVKEMKEKKTGKNLIEAFKYFWFKPSHWFFMTLFRHKGILDGFQGIIFSFFSALRFPRAYWRYIKGRLPHFLMVFVFLTYVLPYPGLMPGNKFYRLEQVADRLGQFWAFGNFSRHKYELNLADKKLVEAKVLFEYQQYPLALQALENSNQHFQKAKAYLGRASKEGKDISQKAINLKAAAEKHKEILGSLENFLPEKFLWQPEKKEATELDLKSTLEEAIKIRQI